MTNTKRSHARSRCRRSRRFLCQISKGGLFLATDDERLSVFAKRNLGADVALDRVLAPDQLARLVLIEGTPSKISGLTHDSAARVKMIQAGLWRFNSSRQPFA
jgi:hypothetical protein